MSLYGVTSSHQSGKLAGPGLAAHCSVAASDWQRHAGPIWGIGTLLYNGLCLLNKSEQKNVSYKPYSTLSSKGVTPSREAYPVHWVLSTRQLQRRTAC